MKTMFIRILQISMIVLLTSTLLDATNIRLVRLLREFTSYDSGTPNVNNWYTTADTLHYSNSSFYQLQSISEGYNHGGGPAHDIYDPIYGTFPCTTLVTQATDSTVIDVSYNNPIHYSNIQTHRVLDHWGRKLAYQDERWYYSFHTQPDSIIGLLDKWFFQYDSLERKSRVDHYAKFNNTWYYRGFYTILYTASDPYPEPLDLSFPDGATDIIGEFVALTDERWPFDSITFQNFSGEMGMTNWHCDHDSTVYISSSGTNGWISFTFLDYGRINSYNSVDGDYGNGSLYIHCDYTWETITVPAHDEIQPVPAIILSQNTPNPFAINTILHYSLKEPGQVSLCIYNIRGQLVKTLVNSRMPIGNHSIEWYGDDSNGNKLASGVYIAKLQEGSQLQTVKLVLVK